MLCIYCRRETSGDEGLAHVYPEAVVQNALTLPRGVVCDDCNNYCGSNLDCTLVEYPAIAIAVQFFALPGKRGRPREILGGIHLTLESASGANLQMTTPEAQVEVADDGRHFIEWSVEPTSAFDMTRFRRALHHVAFNAFALRAGGEATLQVEFDRVRRYVRQPSRHEAWSYAERTVAPGEAPTFGVRWGSEHAENFVLIDVGLTTFAVALQPDQDFSELVRKDHFSVVAPSAMIPPAVRLRYEQAQHDGPAS